MSAMQLKVMVSCRMDEALAMEDTVAVARWQSLLASVEIVDLRLVSVEASIVLNALGDAYGHLEKWQVKREGGRGGRYVAPN
jgi:hypothetical protein